MTKTSQINLCLFNHFDHGVSDQVSWISKVLQEAGVELSISRSLCEKSLNVVIEGFSEFDVEIITDFCLRNDTQVAIVLTEHMELNPELSINFVKLANSNEYLPTAPERFWNLCQLIPFVKYFFTLGVLPDNRKLNRIFQSNTFFSWPAPLISADYEKYDVQDKEYDFSFIGKLTKYRSEIIDQLKKSDFRVLAITGISEKEKLEILKKSLFTLNIPQNESWPVVSPMRIISALEVGTMTLNISHHPSEHYKSLFYSITPAEIESSLEKVRSLWTSDAADKIINDFNASRQRQSGLNQLQFLLNFWNKTVVIPKKGIY